MRRGQGELRYRVPVLLELRYDIIERKYKIFLRSKGVLLSIIVVSKEQAELLSVEACVKIVDYGLD